MSKMAVLSVGSAVVTAMGVDAAIAGGVLAGSFTGLALAGVMGIVSGGSFVAGLAVISLYKYLSRP